MLTSCDVPPYIVGRKLLLIPPTPSVRVLALLALLRGRPAHAVDCRRFPIEAQARQRRYGTVLGNTLTNNPMP